METTESVIAEQLKMHKAFFATHKTKDIQFRLLQLKKLKDVIHRYSTQIEQALWSDLHKSPEETFLTEISIVTQEIDLHIKNLKRWAKPQKVRTPLHLLPSSSRIVSEPLGVALIVAPWNYPFQLLMVPLIGAISAGCCAVVKPSPDAPAFAKVFEQMIKEIFSSEYVSVVQGGRETNTILFKQHFDIIFFTGSPKVGKVVMKAAAEHLTPVVLELGGKSPCVVDEDADIKKAAKRIAWGKLINAGQTCIAPDYLFVHNSIKDRLIDEIIKQITAMYGNDIYQSRFYPRIVSLKAMNRLKGLLSQGSIRFGGEVVDVEKYIAPTIIDDVSYEFAVMQDEIFGPILPVISFSTVNEALEYINKGEKPLAFYYFGKNQKAKEILVKTSSGGACINDTVVHIANHKLPFGGVGNSGMGKYHGYNSFLAFSNLRPVVTTPVWIDLPMRYPPFKYFKLVKRILS